MLAGNCLSCKDRGMSVMICTGSAMVLGVASLFIWRFRIG
jgi:hypothetical protein